MKAFVYGLLIGMIISLGVYAWWQETRTEKHPDPVTEYVENIHKQDSLQFRINALTLLIDSSNAVIKVKTNVIAKQKHDLVRVRSHADSLEEAYNRLRTIDLCDSTIKAKNYVIAEQDTIICSMNEQIGEYAGQVGMLNESVKARDELINEKDSVIDNLHCAYDWKIRHKFWSWVMGWKCNKL